MELHKQYITENLLKPSAQKRRVKTTVDPPLHGVHDDTNQELLVPIQSTHISNHDIDSYTRARRNIQKKYLRKDPWSIGDSIDDKTQFDRRLKLFLHRRKKLELLNFVEKQHREAAVLHQSVSLPKHPQPKLHALSPNKNARPTLPSHYPQIKQPNPNNNNYLAVLSKPHHSVNLGSLHTSSILRKARIHSINYKASIS